MVWKSFRIFKLGRELVLKNYAIFLNEANHCMLLKLQLIGKNLLDNFSVGRLLGDDI